MGLVMATLTGTISFFTAMGGTIALVLGEEEGGLVALVVSGFFCLATLILLGIRRHLQKRAALRFEAPPARRGRRRHLEPMARGEYTVAQHRNCCCCRRLHDPHRSCETTGAAAVVHAGACRRHRHTTPATQPLR